MTHTFKVGEPQITRDGQEVVIWSDEGIGDYPLLGGVRDKKTGKFKQENWNKNGFRYDKTHSDWDLMPPAPKKHKQTVWFNVYGTFDDKIYLMHQSDELQAKSCNASNRISTFSREIEFEEGEGL